MKIENGELILEPGEQAIRPVCFVTVERGRDTSPLGP